MFVHLFYVRKLHGLICAETSGDIDSKLSAWGEMNRRALAVLCPFSEKGKDFKNMKVDHDGNWM